MSAAIAGSASGALGPQAMWPHLAIRGTLGALYVAAFFEAVKRLPLGDAVSECVLRALCVHPHRGGLRAAWTDVDCPPNTNTPRHACPSWFCALQAPR